ncbi:MAG: acyl transferase [Pedobacter sp.]|nr:MAG: acyl transferase [Pedobacter sp.]
MSESEFEVLGLEIFKYQSENCDVYRSFIKHLVPDSKKINSIRSVPFLPVSFFKSQKIISGPAPAGIIFKSSATTGITQSQHFVQDVSIYEQSYLSAFELFYGKPDDLCILALLPSYQERDGSSLIYMVDDLIHKSRHPQSGYFLNDNEGLIKVLSELQKTEQPTLLIGVTYALLDLIEAHNINFPELMVMETGGMKGKRKELVREALHNSLKSGFGVPHIHSEYGMTELLSQAYSKGEGIFECPPWMKVMIRDINDPLNYVADGKTGGINIVDLANINSCSFIATQDLGRYLGNNRFEVLGRFDNADIRGCNLLVQ